MNKYIRGKNANNNRRTGLFVAQIIVGVMPVLVLVAFVLLKLYTNPFLWGGIAIGIIIICNGVYIVMSRRYNVLNSGIRGEKQLYKTVKKLPGNNIIFRNLPIKYKRGRSEADLLLISKKGVIIIEVKNHSGVISGSWGSEKWKQTKHYRDGKQTEIEMDNPIKQMRRQRDIVKSILNYAGESVWIDTILYFSNPGAKLRLNLRENDYVCQGSDELMRLLRNYESGESLSKARMENIAQIIIASRDR